MWLTAGRERRAHCGRLVRDDRGRGQDGHGQRVRRSTSRRSAATTGSGPASPPGALAPARGRQTRTELAAARLTAIAGAAMPGDRLGSKEELRTQCGVSVGTFNEAIRLLQARKLVTVRPGPGGGLFAAERLPMVRLGNSVLALDAGQTSVANAVRIRDALDPLMIEDALWHSLPRRHRRDARSGPADERRGRGRPRPGRLRPGQLGPARPDRRGQPERDAALAVQQPARPDRVAHAVRAAGRRSAAAGVHGPAAPAARQPGGGTRRNATRTRRCT